MAYKDPAHAKRNRPRINLADEEFKALEALAVLHKKQLSSYLRSVILEHLNQFQVENDKNTLRRVG